MVTPEPAWDYYRSFLAVARQGSLSGAARVLGLTQPTVGRHIALLEESLGGGALFTRSPSGLIPTAAARELRPHAEAMESAAAILRRRSRVDQESLRGVVRVTASGIMSTEVLPPLLTSFRAKHPGIELELDVDNDVADLLRGDADIAVRMARPLQQQIFAKRIGLIPFALHAHRRYLEAHGTPRNADDLLQRHTLIGFDTIPPWLRIQGLPFHLTRKHFAVRCDDDRAVLAAMRAGLGIGACHCAIARRDPDLVVVLPGLFTIDRDLWVAMHADQRKTHPVRALFEHLTKALKEYQRSGL
jgi:DNA-binding transcriptional LysR family regulator